MDILLGGFQEQEDFVCLFSEEADNLMQRHYDKVNLMHFNKVFDLVHRMAQYLHKATVKTIPDTI